jgi:hypothetical protein
LGLSCKRSPTGRDPNRFQNVAPQMAAYRKRDFLRTVTPALLTDGLRIEGGI